MSEISRKTKMPNFYYRYQHQLWQKKCYGTNYGRGSFGSTPTFTHTLKIQEISLYTISTLSTLTAVFVISMNYMYCNTIVIVCIVISIRTPNEEGHV